MKLALFALAFLAATNSPRAVSLAGPSFLFAPATVKFRVTVEPFEDQRLLRVTADSGAFLRSSDIPLRGCDGPKTTWVDWRDLPGGNYEVAAIVVTNNREVARTMQSLRIISRGP